MKTECPNCGEPWERKKIGILGRVKRVGYEEINAGRFSRQKKYAVCQGCDKVIPLTETEEDKKPTLSK